jgi:hypothetical protein
MMNDTLAQQLKFLRLPGLLAGWDELLKAAAQSNLSHARLLTRVVEEEYRLKCDQARQQRLTHAKIPERWVQVVLEDRFTAIAAIDHVVDGAGILHAQLSGHVESLPAPAGNVHGEAIASSGLTPLRD